MSNTKKTLVRIEGKIDKLLEINEVTLYTEEVLKLTLIEWLYQWLELYKKDKVKPSTLYHLQVAIKKYLVTGIGKSPLTDIDGMHIQRFLMRIKAPRQRQHIYGILRDAFNRAYALQLIGYNPIPAIKLPTYHKKRSKAFDRKQEDMFIKACNSHKNGLILIIMLYAGLRRGEALALNFSDIDIVNRKIYITKTINGFGKVGTPKTESSIREVPIFNSLYPYLINYTKRQSRRIFDYSEYIVNNAFWDILRSVGLYGQGFTTHSLRHTFVTRCIENNVPIKVVQKWVGHSTSVMTMNVYAHINNDFEEKAIRDFNNKLT
ncbi:MAG: tyrosine-type recombinase/integrase [Bacillota bacterium]